MASKSCRGKGLREKPEGFVFGGAHNPKVAGSNPAPATKKFSGLRPRLWLFRLCGCLRQSGHETVFHYHSSSSSSPTPPGKS